MNKCKHTEEDLRIAVQESISIAQVLKKLGYKQFAGGTFSHIKKRILKFNIDISHFKGKGWSKGLPSRHKQSWQEILILRNDGYRQDTFRLRRALIESGREYKCEICGQLPIWYNKELRLQIDHIDGNFENDKPENIRFICPNCHTQTDGYNGSKGRSHLTKGYRKPNIHTNNNWRHKPKPEKRKVVRPEYKILLKELQESNYCAVGRKYGVSDKAIKKWIKCYEWSINQTQKLNKNG